MRAATRDGVGGFAWLPAARVRSTFLLLFAFGEAAGQAAEEAGLEIGDLFRIGEILVTPGGSSERLVLYCGRCDAANAGGVHGLACEDEDIRVVVLTLDHALAAIDDGRIRTANAVIPLLWLALNRERVRDAWRQAG